MEKGVKIIWRRKKMAVAQKSLHRHFAALDYPISQADINSALAFTYKQPSNKKSRIKITPKQFLIGLFSAGITLLIISQVIPR